MVSISLRKSQFIHTYGPGAIVDFPDGRSRIVCLPSDKTFSELAKRLNKKLNEFMEFVRISHPRSETALRVFNVRYIDKDMKEIPFNVKIYRVPTYEELGISQTESIFESIEFPSWYRCINHNIIFRGYRRTRTCPKGNNGTCKMVPVKFILTCGKGHIQDIDWIRFAHKGKKKRKECKPSYLIYYEEGMTLKEHLVKCPECESERRLHELYVDYTEECRGEYKERCNRLYNNNKCEEEAHVVERQASYIWIPNILHIFTIPPNVTELHNLLLTYVKKDDTALQVARSYLDGDIKLKNLIKILRFDSSHEMYIKYHDEEFIRNVLREVIEYKEPLVGNDLTIIYKSEFEALKEGAEQGFPPIKHYLKEREEEILFYMDKSNTFDIKIGNISFKIASVDKLHYIMVLTSYTRNVRRANILEPVDVGTKLQFGGNEEKWYPGVDLWGEGIFITSISIDIDKFQDIEEWKRWMDTYKRVSIKDQNVKKDAFEFSFRYHPWYVFWHTFGHVLLKSLSFHSGYPLASLQERAYTVTYDEKVDGGVLIYTARTSMGMTPGGLVSLFDDKDELKRILIDTFSEELQCSNDPVCRDTKFRDKGLLKIKSSCYACTFVPEVSCEVRNLYLDRQLLNKVLFN